MNEGEQPAQPQWQYNQEAQAPQPLAGGQILTPAATAVPSKAPAVQWTASEYIAHHKGVGWHVLVLVGTVVLAAAIFFLLHDKISTAVVVICGLIFSVAGARKPRVLSYRLDDNGLTIANRFYAYNNYKSFSVIDEGSFSNITFLPLKRFMPDLSIYFAPQDEEHIVDVLSNYLPLQPSSSTIFDSIIHRIRF